MIDFLESNIHEVVAVYEMAIEGFAIFQFDKLKSCEYTINVDTVMLTMGLFCAALRSDKGS